MAAEWIYTLVFKNKMIRKEKIWVNNCKKKRVHNEINNLIQLPIVTKVLGHIAKYSSYY